jgi:large subunit ribosomal protein L4
MTKIKSSANSNDTGVIFNIVAPKDLQLTEKQKKPFDEVAYAQCVRAILQNWRQGTVGCKDRSEVSFSNKKPWKQKGTGRARAGSARSPLWRKGGVIFGPQPRTRTLKVAQNVKQNVCNSLLWHYLENKSVFSLNWMPSEKGPKTSLAFSALKNAGLHDRKIVLFVNEQDILTQLSFANLPNVRILFFDQANAYDLSNCECWVFLDKDLNIFKEMVDTWI